MRTVHACVCLCILHVCVRERTQSPRDSVSHQLHRKAALLGLAWVRPLLSSSNMPTTCSLTRPELHMNMHTHTCSHTHMCTCSHTYTQPCRHKPVHMACKEFICGKTTKFEHFTFNSQDPRAEGYFQTASYSHTKTYSFSPTPLRGRGAAFCTLAGFADGYLLKTS